MFQVTLRMFYKCNMTVIFYSGLWWHQKMNKYFVNMLQVVIPVSSVRDVKKYNSALSMLSIQTVGEKVRLCTYILFFIIFVLLFCFTFCAECFGLWFWHMDVQYNSAVKLECLHNPDPKVLGDVVKPLGVCGSETWHTPYWTPRLALTRINWLAYVEWF